MLDSRGQRCTLETSLGYCAIAFLRICLHPFAHSHRSEGLRCGAIIIHTSLQSAAKVEIYARSEGPHANMRYYLRISVAGPLAGGPGIQVDILSYIHQLSSRTNASDLLLPQHAGINEHLQDEPYVLLTRLRSHLRPLYSYFVRLLTNAFRFDSEHSCLNGWPRKQHIG